MNPLLKWTVRIVLVLLLLVAALWAVSFLLPATVLVQRSVQVKAPPEKAYALVVAPARWKEWTVWNQRDPKMEMAYFGPPSGSGAGWSWHSASEGDGRMTLTATEPPHRVAYDLFFPDFGSISTGELRFEPEAGGTRVTWVMTTDMGHQSLARWMGLFMDHMVGPDFEAGLARLRDVAEQST